MGRRAKTAAEALAELEKDPTYIAMRTQMEMRQESLERLLVEDERRLVEELADVGVHVNSVWDLVNTSHSYAAAIPVLLRHLSANHHRRTREGIARALIVPEARETATGELIAMFRRFNDPDADDFKWVLAHAVAASATPLYLQDIVAMARDKRHGMARGPLLRALCLLDKNQAVSILSEFVCDPDTRSDARKLLRALRR